MRDLTWLRTHAQGLRAWLDAVQTALAFWPPDSDRIGLTEFLAVAEAAIRSATVSVPDDRIETVHVMSALEARQWNLSALFLCGATDRDYPRKHPRHLLLAATDIDKLAREGIRNRTAEDQDADEQKLFDSLETRARSLFVVTYPQHDAAGRGVLPSRFIQVAAPAARNCAPQPRAQRTAQPHPARIASAELLAELKARHQTVSTTHIESLAQCPFQFFARKTLQLEPRPEKPQERIGPREAGLILHETLQLWLEDRSQDFAALFEKAFERACVERHLPRGYRLEVERFTLRNIARAVSATHSWPVEFSEAEVEVNLPLVDGVTMTGRVDRVDHIGGSDCVVIDYKSKGKGGMKRLIESETSLQGPLYALALRRQSGLNTVAMAYWAVRENELHGWGEIPGYKGERPLQPMPPDWENVAWTRIAARLAAFFGGDISPVHTDEDSCRFCDARDCCRVEESTGLVMIETARA
jgi:ATP-dependent helicase/DNAse subunit B